METMDTTDPLDRPATRAALEALYGVRLLGARARREAVGLVRPPRMWWAWADRIVLFLGVTLLLAGIVFFFAWNWAAMAPWLKFSLIGGALLACIIGAGCMGFERITGRVTLLAASVLVGVFLAVHGQVYQTGADAFELFLAWAVLILGWVVLARFAALWVVWLTLVNTGVFLYWDQVMVQDSCYFFPAAPFTILAVVNGLALLAREAGHGRGVDWLQDLWHRYLILAAVLTWLTTPVVVMITDFDEACIWTWVSAVLWAATLPAAVWFHRTRTRDLLSLTLLAASACVVVLSLLGRGLSEVVGEKVFLLIMGFLILGVVSLAVFWLRFESKASQEGRHGE